MNKKELLREKEDLLEYMDVNDAHMSAFAVNKLIEINDKLSKL